jgi:actin-related protein
MGINSIGITEAVDLGDPYNSLGKENIVVLIGAGSSVHGIQRKYLEKENKLKVVCPPERRYSAWIGGSIVGSISTYASNVVTKEQYAENGSSVWYRTVFKL